MFSHFDCVSCGSLWARRVLMFIFCSFWGVFWCVCVFLSVEEKRGRQLAEIEGNDCDLRTKSRAKCFLPSLFSLFSTFCPSKPHFPSSLHHFLSFALHNKAARKKKKKIEHQPIFFHLLCLSCGSKLPSIENSSGAYCAACGLNRLKQGTFPGVIKKSRQYRSWNISAKLCFHWKTCSSLKNYIIYPDLNLLVRATDGWMLSCPLFSFFSLLSAIISSLFNFSYLPYASLCYQDNSPTVPLSFTLYLFSPCR